MQIKKKLMLAFAVPIILIGAVALSGRLWSNGVVVKAINDDVGKVNASLEMEISEVAAIKNVFDYVSHASDISKEKYYQQSEKFKKYLVIYKQYEHGSNESEIINKVEHKFNDFTKIAEALFSANSNQMQLLIKQEMLINNDLAKLIQTNKQFNSQQLAEIKDIESNVIKMAAEVKGYVIDNNHLRLEKINQAKANLADDLANFRKVNLTKQNENWFAGFSKTIDDINAGTEQIIASENSINAQLVKLGLVSTSLGALIDNDLQKYAATQLANSKHELLIINWLIFLFLISIALLSLIIAWFISGRLVKPITYLKLTIERLRKGESVDIVKKSSDEIGDLSDSFAELVHENKEHNQKITEQSWLKEYVAEISKLAQTKNNINEMAAAVISKIAEAINAGCAAFYMAKFSEDKLDHLTLIASYAYKKRKHIANKFKLGEGLVGQAALEGKPILLTAVPDDYIFINSGLGEKQPNNILVMPLVLEGKTKAVIEVASFHVFTEIQQQLFEQLGNNLSVIIEALQSRDATEIALHQVRQQAEELQAQQEELRSSNEELEEKTKILQQSEEELRTQSEELQATNEELEEKTQLLQEQRDQLDEKKKAVEEAKRIVDEKAIQLSKASQYKSEFLANMSHELRTPLNIILLLSKSFSENESGNLTKDQIEEAELIFRGGKDLLDLINDILDLSKIEAGKFSIEAEPTNTEELLRDIQEQFTSLSQAKNLEFSIDNKLADKIINTDGHRLKQILRNLLSNAIKFTEKGSVKVVVNQSAENSSYIEFNVIDTGIGIAKDKQELIFEAFQQADGSIDRKYGGTGLGMTISRKLAELLGGKLMLESVEGTGTTFTLVLPVEYKGAATTLNMATPSSVPTRVENKPEQSSSSIAETAAVAKPEKIPSKPLHRNGVILCVDDDPIFLNVLVKIGEKKGYHCLAASSGREALELAKTENIKGILLDLGLPDIDGVAVLQQLKSEEATKNIPIHIISGRDPASLPESFRKIDFIKKPIENEQLNQLFNQLASINGSDESVVLIVEDNPATLLIVKKALNQKSIAYDVAETGREAIEKMCNTHFGTVILDYNLPDMTGQDVLKSLKEMGVEIPPVIIYTAEELTRKQIDELGLEASAFVQKTDASLDRLLSEVSLFLHALDKKENPFQKQAVKIMSNAEEIFKNKKVLLVDDDSRNIYVMKKLLEGKGISVVHATNGQEAVDAVKSGQSFALILMDIMMPVMDGYEAMRQIRLLPKQQSLPIIAVTAKAMREDKQACLEAGASDYLVKPVDPDKLLSMMRIWFSK